MKNELEKLLTEYEQTSGGAWLCKKSEEELAQKLKNRKRK